MRLFDLKAMRVETAGQSTEGALVTVVGIADMEGFRDAVLDQRDRVSDRDDDSSQKAEARAPADKVGVLLTDIRDSLKRIEQGLASGSPRGGGGR